MRMLLPPVRERRVIDRLLSEFFRDCRPLDFRRAMVQLSRYYRLPAPPVVWFEYLDWGKTAGRTYEDGKIHLVHPENWKRGRKYNSERRWINTIYHEMGHYIFWADAERKADTFAYRMVRGLTAPRAGRLPPKRAVARLTGRVVVGKGAGPRDRIGARAVAVRRGGPAHAAAGGK